MTSLPAELFMRQRIKVSCSELVYYDLPHPCTYLALLELIDAHVTDIPEDQLKNVLVEFHAGDEFESGRLEFTFYRDETDTEMANRIENEKRRREWEGGRIEAEAYATYQQLKRKFEP